SSVTIVAISTITWRAGSSPVISRSIHTSIAAPYPPPARLTSEAMPHPVSVPVRQLDPDLPLPTYARQGDAGLDVMAREDAVIPAGGGRALIPTGIAFALPDGYAAFVQPRSGLALKHGVT